MPPCFSPMFERSLQLLKVEFAAPSETAAEARDRLRDRFPRQAVRRMTHLGLLLGSALEGVALMAEDAVVYASRFAETRALEDYLASFPTPSPLLFQTSIHPGGVQQVLIGRQQSVSRLWPVAGGARLIEQALLAALLETAPRVVLVGGEERGTWLGEYGLASAEAFAFAAVLTRDVAGGSGRVVFRPGTADCGAPEPAPELPAFARALRDGAPQGWRGAAGEWEVTVL